MKKLLLSLSLITSLSVIAQANASSISFDGVDDEVICDNPLTNGMGEFTIMLYSNFPQLSSGALVTDWPAGGATFKIDQWANNGSNVIRMNLNTSSGSLELLHPLTPNDYNTWINWAFTFDGLNLKLFKNGQLVQTANGTTQGTISPSSSVIRFGQEENNPSFYTGLIDEPHIWNIALTEQQIQDYMDCSPTGSETGLVGYWNFEEGTGTTAGDLTSNGNDGTLTNGPTWSTDVPPYNCCTPNPITSQPTDVAVPLNGTGMFSTTTSVTSPTYQWQMDNGTGYMDLTNAGQFSGVDTDMLTVSNVTLGENNTLFRCIVTENSNCSDTTDVAELTVEDNTGLEELNQRISIYPNPTSTSFTITSKNSINSSFKLMDTQGKVVLKGIIESTEETVDISKLSKGQYNLVFEDESISPISIIKN